MRIHPHDLLLQEIAVTPPESQAKGRKHLATCAYCQDRLRRLHALQPDLRQRTKILPFGRSQALPNEYGPAIDGASRSLRSIEDVYGRERAAAPALYAELIQHPINRHLLLVRNCPRFHSWGFCEHLLYRGQTQSYEDAALGEKLGLLAVEVLDHLETSRYGAEPLEDLRARAWSYVANARRIQEDLQGAEEAFTFAFSFLHLGTGEPLERALLLDLKSSLLTRQRHFPEALGVLRLSLSIFRKLGETHRAGRALVNMSTIYALTGEPEQAISMLYQALELIDPAREPRLMLIARHNLIDDLIEAGQLMEGQKLLAQSRPLYKRFPQPWFQNHRLWIEGKLLRGLGQADQAEALLLAARNGFLGASAAFDTALVSFDISSLYAEQGRMEELGRVAEAMVPIFSSRQIHQEAMAALDYWRQALEAKQVCSALIAGVASFLKQARHNLDLKFQRPE
jgi:tetratricopeptide (TPR) repeat protein